MIYLIRIILPLLNRVILIDVSGFIILIRTPLLSVRGFRGMLLKVKETLINKGYKNGKDNSQRKDTTNSYGTSNCTIRICRSLVRYTFTLK